MTFNRLRFFARILPAAALMLAVAGCKMFSDSPRATVAAVGTRASEVRGGVRVTDASKQWRKLDTGDAVATGNLIQTAMESAADIIVDAGAGNGSSRVLLQSDSVLAIEGLPGAGANDLRLDLRSGWLTLTSPSTGPSPLCEVKFANGLAGAHGATFHIHADGHLKVLVGSVVVKLLDDQPARTIASGTQFDPQTGQVTAISAGAAMGRPAPLPVAPSAPLNRPATDPFPWMKRPK